MEVMTHLENMKDITTSHENNISLTQELLTGYDDVGGFTFRW